MRKQKGFSLIELLIVVAIILIIAAIAVPNLLRSRMAANESSAVGSMRTLISSEMTYFTSFGGGTSYGTMAQLYSNNLIDSVLASGTKSGYSLQAAPAGTNNNQFYAAAAPVQVGTTGQRGFCATEDGSIKFDTTGTPPASHDACQSSTNALQ